MDSLIQDVRGGLRMLAAKPIFTTLAVVTLALGIGANTTIFSVVHAVLLKPLPYEEPEELVFLWNSIPSANVNAFPLSPAEFVHYREHTDAFEDVAVSQARSYNLSGRELPERFPGALVSRNLFRLLGVEAFLGRTFVTANEGSEDDNSILISFGLWNRLFGAAPDILGERLIVNNAPRTVVGVMPRGFDFPGEADLWVPAVFSPEQLGREGLGQQFVRGLARLRDGVSLSEAQHQIDRTAQQFHRQHADFYEDGHPWKVTLVPILQQLTGSVHTPLAILLGSVTLVLLVACANVSSLLLARAAARQGELAIRAALGAGSVRLARMLVTEGVVLALLGGGAALLVAYVGMDAVRAVAPEGVPRLDELRIDGRVLAFTFGVSILVGLLSAILPAFQSARFDLQQGLKAGATSLPARSPRRARNFLVVAELALALVLTIGAALLTKSFFLLSQVDPGFQAGGVLSLDVSLSPLKYRDARQTSVFNRDAVRQIEALTGVESAAVVSTLPLAGRDNRSAFTVEGDADPDARETAVHYRLISSGYFRTLGIPVLRGRALHDGDDVAAPPVVVINQTMARLLWPNSVPLGRRINFGNPDESPWYRIVGVVGDVKHLGLDAQPEMEVYMTYSQAPYPAPSTTIVARTSGEPERLGNAIRSRILSVDPNQPVYNVRPLSAVLSSSVAPQRFNVVMMSAFAVLCLVLAAVGIYGVISYSVGQRIRELGIRMALGARRRDVLKLILGQGALLTVVGVLIGVVGALALTRLLSGLLYGVQPTDPMTFAGVTVFLCVVALLASYLPARRAAKIEPVIALRHD